MLENVRVIFSFSNGKRGGFVNPKDLETIKKQQYFTSKRAFFGAAINKKATPYGVALELVT